MNIPNTVPEQYRQEIDQIDNEIISLFAKRFAVVEKIGHYKASNNLSVYQAGRWKHVLEKAIKKGHDIGLSSSFIQHVWKIIHHHALYIQYKHQGNYTKKNPNTPH